jgi:hypothetical protein
MFWQHFPFFSVPVGKRIISSRLQISGVLGKS